MSSYFRKVQGEPGIDAEGNDEEGLDGMDDKDEIKRFFVSHTIKDEHRHAPAPSPHNGKPAATHNNRHGSDRHMAMNTSRGNGGHLGRR